jgi:ABC-type transport system involved in cytochrome c biogenesis permease subunit
MVFGSIWGIVSWGAYFLWDAKILWSLAAWVYYATFLHLRYWPAPSPGWRLGLAAVGFALVLGTYVGTSFMTGSIHAF